jgi:hypothetical protein
VNGDIGRSPFCGQLSGKPLPASTYASCGSEIKAQGCVENLIRGGGGRSVRHGFDDDGAGGGCGEVIIVRSDVVDGSKANCPMRHKNGSAAVGLRLGDGRLVCLAANGISLSRFGRTKACVAGALFFCSRSPICLIRS